MIKKFRKATSTADTLIITIPKFMIELLELSANQDVDVSLKGGKIILTPIKEELEETNEK